MGIGLGIGVGRQRFSGGGGGFDADYQKILTLSSAAGYTLPSSANQVKQNELYVALKNAGILAKLDTFALFANDGSSNFGLVDWIRTVNTNTLVLMTAVNSPTWTANQGFQSNGTSSFIDSNYNPTNNRVNLSLNDAAIGFWEFSTTTGANGVNAGADDGNNDILLSQKFATGNELMRMNDNNSTARPSSANYSAGLVVGQRVNSTTLQYYTPAKVLNSYTINSIALNNQSITFLKFATVFGLTPISMGFIGASLSSGQIDALYNASNAYFS
jgi:hypothetical protein